MHVELVACAEYSGSADAVRAVEGRLRGDFIVFSADFLSQFSLVDLVRQHRLQTSDVTMLLSVPPKDMIKDDIDKEYIAFGTDGRIYIKTPVLEVEDEDMEISKTLIMRAKTFSLRHDLLDMGVYVCARWVKDLVVSRKHWSSIRSDLIPYLLRCQFQPADYLQSVIPAANERIHGAIGAHEIAQPSTPSVNDSVFSTDAAKEDASHSPQVPVDFLRCFGIVYDISQVQTSSTSPVPSTTPSVVLTRLLHIAAYQALNRDMPLISYNHRTPWNRASNYLRKEQTVVGETVDLSDKTITLKQCSVGHHVRLGAKSKLNNCIVMNHVTIGEK